MVDRTPLLNGLSVKMRAKQYDAGTVSQKSGASAMSKRAAGYTGKKLAQQSETQKGTMSKRAAKYTGKGEDIRPYTANCQFRLRIGDYAINCNKVTNLAVEREIEEVQEGGNNLFPNVFLSSKKKADRLRIERALVNDDIVSVFSAGRHVSGGILELLKNGKQFKRFHFDKGLIVKLEYSNLDALGSDVMIYTMEIAHTGLILE